MRQNKSVPSSFEFGPAPRRYRRPPRKGDKLSVNIETEIKLRVDGDQMDRLRASPWWRGLDGGASKDLHSVYFDTENRRLRKLGVSLRTRNKDDVTEQTLKLDAGREGAFSRREWTAVIPDDFPDPGLVIDSALPEAVRKLTAADLGPVFNIDVRREIREIKAGDVSAEIALDDGAVLSGQRRAPLREVEIELRDGARPALIREARRIVDMAGGRLHLRSKADLGYALAGGESGGDRRETWTKAPKLTLPPKCDVAGAVQEILFLSLRHLTENDDCARSRAHVEGVHQCRVALRRMRSAIRLFGPVLPREPFRTLTIEIKRLSGVLGAARDLDVLESDLLAPAVDAVDAPEDAALLVAALERQREEAYREVSAALSSARYGQFLLDLLAVAGTDDWRNAVGGKAREALARPAKSFAAEALDRAHAQLLKRGKGFKKMSSTERHALRIEIKKMRYASESLSSLFKAKRARRFSERLADLQDGLGALNDVAVAEGLLARLIDKEAARRDAPASDADRARQSYAAGCILGWHRRRAAERDAELVGKWRDFRRAEPFWR